MLSLFNLMREGLISDADNDGARIHVDRSIGFANNTKWFNEILGEINHVTRELQRKRLRHSECRSALDILK